MTWRIPRCSYCHIPLAVAIDLKNESVALCLECKRTWSIDVIEIYDLEYMTCSGTA
jgi:hypothetical protein